MVRILDVLPVTSQLLLRQDDMEITSVVRLVIVLVVLGVCLFLIENYIPLTPPLKVVIRVIVVLVSCLLLLRFAGLL